MDGRVRRFREQARKENRGRRGTALRYSPELRSDAVAYVREGRGRGVPRAVAARALGVPDRTVSRWEECAGHAGFRRVETTGPDRESAAAAPRGLVLTTRDGDRVEGLDVADLAALLRALQ